MQQTSVAKIKSQKTKRRYSALQLRRLPALLMLFALALSSLYLGESGLPQISHIIAAAAVGLGLLTHPYLHWKRGWILGVGFVSYTAFVDLAIFALYGDMHTLLSPLYYMFGFIIFVYLVNISINLDKTFINIVFWIHVIQLLSLTLLCLFGIGKYFGSSRFMGFFNDPNQMGNWVLWSAIIISAMGRVIYKSWLPGLLATAIASVAIVFTASRSATVGLLILFGLYFLMGTLHLLLFIVGLLKVKRIILSTLLVFVLFFSLIILSGSTFSQEESVITRVTSQAMYLMVRFEERDLDDTWEGRGYDRLWKFPQYLLFGAGEGATERFAEKTRFLGEIHSGWVGVLFNYGLIGSLLFFGFLYVVIHDMKVVWFKLMLLPPIAYGFATYNIRNWYFWIGLAVLYICSVSLQHDIDEGKKLCCEKRV